MPHAEKLPLNSWKVYMHSVQIAEKNLAINSDFYYSQLQIQVIIKTSDFEINANISKKHEIVSLNLVDGKLENIKKKK